MYEAEGCLIWAIIVFAVITIGTLPFFVTYNTTRAGQHNGYVTAVEQGGLIFHNYKVYFKTDNSSSQEDIYCVQREDTQLADELKEANAKKAPVTIHYDGVRAIGLGLCQEDKIVDVEFE